MRKRGRDTFPDLGPALAPEEEKRGRGRGGAEGGGVEEWWMRGGTANEVAEGIGARAPPGPGPVWCSHGWALGFWKGQTGAEVLAAVGAIFDREPEALRRACTSEVGALPAGVGAGSGASLLVHDMQFEGESVEDYGTPLVTRNRVLRSCVEALAPGGALVWIDMALPMYRKDELTYVAKIGLARSDAARFRVLSVFIKRELPRTLTDEPARTLAAARRTEHERGVGGAAARLADGFNAHRDFARRPKLFLDRGVAYAMWMVGNDYRNKSTYHGAYPASLLARYEAMLADRLEPLRDRGERFLHLFSGALPPSDRYLRFDAVREAELRGDAEQLASVLRAAPDATPPGGFEVILADPPYSRHDAQIYKNERLVNRERVLAECAQVLRPGGVLVWLDCVTWNDVPGTRVPPELAIAGYMGLVRSTNHRFRLITVFVRR